jgi:hypothetical protein
VTRTLSVALASVLAAASLWLAWSCTARREAMDILERSRRLDEVQAPYRAFALWDVDAREAMRRGAVPLPVYERRREALRLKAEAEVAEAKRRTGR